MENLKLKLLNCLAGLTVILSGCTRDYDLDNGLQGEEFRTKDESGFVYGIDNATHSAYVLGYEGEATSIKIPEILRINKTDFPVRSIASYAFNGCKTLQAVKLPATLVSIQGGAFMHCYSLRSIDIPDSVLEIGASAFSYCYNLEEVIIGANVQLIGSGAFYESSGVIYSYAKFPPEIPSGIAFAPNRWYVHVPKGSTYDYQGAKGWQYQKGIIADL